MSRGETWGSNWKLVEDFFSWKYCFFRDMFEILQKASSRNIKIKTLHTKKESFTESYSVQKTRNRNVISIRSHPRTRRDHLLRLENRRLQPNQAWQTRRSCLDIQSTSVPRLCHCFCHTEDQVVFRSRRWVEKTRFQRILLRLVVCPLISTSLRIAGQLWS